MYGEIVLWKLEMQCLKSSQNQLFVACNIFGVRYVRKEKKRAPQSTPSRRQVLDKEATSEKCLDIAITVMST